MILDNVFRYLKIFYKGLMGIGIEVIFPLLTFAAAFLVCYAVYWLVII